MFSYWSVVMVRSLLSGAAGCALPQMKTTARLSGCVRAAAAAPPSGCTRSVCSAGSTRSSGATAQLASPARSAMLNTSLSFPNWVGEISSIFKFWWCWGVNKLWWLYSFLIWLKRQFSRIDQISFSMTFAEEQKCNYLDLPLQFCIINVSYYHFKCVMGLVFVSKIKFNFV